MRRDRRLFVLVALILVGGVIGVVRFFDVSSVESTGTDTATGSVIDTTTPRVMSSLESVEGALVDLLENPRLEGCHGAAHEIGRQASFVAEPLEVLQLNTPEVDQRCQYGFIHGLFQGYAAQGISAITIANTSCHRVPGDPGVVSECFHASGHGVAITQTTLVDALADCEMIDAPHDLNCATGVYMEYMDRYWLGDAVPSGTSGYAPLLSEQEALSVCAWTSQQWVAVCAKEAPAFWGRSNSSPTFLGQRCRELAESTAVDVIHLCGVGVGRRFQNAAVWNLSGVSLYPETTSEAREISRSLATSCEEATRAAGALGFWSGCIEAAIQPMLSGQILTKTPPAMWIDPCPTIVAEEWPQAMHLECVRIRTDVISDIERISEIAS